MTSEVGQRTALRLLTLGLAITFLSLCSPFVVALVLSAWFAGLARPVLLRLGQLLHGRHRAAAVLTVALLLLLLLPASLAFLSLSKDAVGFARRILSSPDGRNALLAIVSEGGGAPSLRIPDLLPLLQEHGSRALSVLRVLFGATLRGALGLFIFVLGSYTLLIDGPGAYRWFAERLPLSPAHLRRFADAFYETGRGLVIGVGLTALCQGALATILFLALRLPSALTLGLLTCIAALIPGLGTALVFVPVAAGLLLTGRVVAAAVLAAVGFLVIGTVDNILRPLLVRYGRLQLPAFVLFLSIFGGLSMFGAFGFLLGPLIARLAREALDMWREPNSGSQ